MSPQKICTQRPAPQANEWVAHVSLLRHGVRRLSISNLLPQPLANPQNPGLKRETWATREPTQLPRLQRFSDSVLPP